jgi:hypothetical protein
MKSKFGYALAPHKTTLPLALGSGNSAVADADGLDADF